MELMRQVAVVLFADVVGYSKLTEAQIKTFMAIVLPDFADQVLHKHRSEFLELNTWGDGTIIAASDPYLLAQLALDFRDFYRNRHWAGDHLPKLSVRIALHAGSVYVGHDPVRNARGIIGSQVNLTARLEPVVDPGEIAVTDQFFGLIPKDQDLPFAFDDLGDKPLAKNYGVVHAHRLRRPWEAAPPPGPGPIIPAPAPLATDPPVAAREPGHPLKNRAARSALVPCKFVIMFPRFKKTGRWNFFGDVLVEILSDLPEWAEEAYLIPSARALPQFRDAMTLKDSDNAALLEAKKTATLRFVDEQKYRDLDGVWFEMPVTKGKAIGVYCLDYDLFLNASAIDVV